jgi:hypothetical protein
LVENLKRRKYCNVCPASDNILKGAVMNIYWKLLERINMAEDRKYFGGFVNTVMNIWKIFLADCKMFSFPISTMLHRFS